MDIVALLQSVNEVSEESEKDGNRIQHLLLPLINLHISKITKVRET